MINNSKLTSIDLFAGCGGLSLGLEQAGFQPLFVNEINNDALDTYLMNREEYPYLKEDEFHKNDIKDCINPDFFTELFKNLKKKHSRDFRKHNVRISLISPGFIKTPLTNKNTFSMPFIKTPEFAANKIYNGLTKSSAFEIHFPKELTILLKLLRILPYKIYLFLINEFVKRD